MGKIGDWLEGWLLRIALKKGVKAAVTFILAFLASAKIAPVAAQLGVTVDPGKLEVGLTAIGTGLITVLLNYLKQKTKLGKKIL